MNRSDWIEVARCGRPHGVRGAFSLDVYAGNETALRPKLRVRVVSANGDAEFTVQSIQVGNKGILMLDGIENRNQVEAMIPFTLWVKRSDFPILTQGQVYISDIVGSEAWSESGKVGTIIDFYENGAQVVFTIRLENGEQMDLPYIEDFFPNRVMPDNRVFVRIPHMID